MTGVEAVTTTQPRPEAAPAASHPGAPPGLARVLALVNTLDLEEGVDELFSPLALASWLESHGLGQGGERLTDDDLVRARAVREALRDLLGGNAGHPVDQASVAILDDVSAATPLAVRFGDDGRPVLRPAGEGLAAALGALLADIATAVANGSWVRLKTCRNDTCRWAYWDGSKNRSGAWCSMAVCGNRMKGRRYRRRRQERPTAT
jgi:predicted RNA-binding Zn ribbon-like protein